MSLVYNLDNETVGNGSSVWINTYYNPFDVENNGKNFSLLFDFLPSDVNDKELPIIFNSISVYYSNSGVKFILPDNIEYNYNQTISSTSRLMFAVVVDNLTVTVYDNQGYSLFSHSYSSISEQSPEDIWGLADNTLYSSGTMYRLTFYDNAIYSDEIRLYFGIDDTDNNQNSSGWSDSDLGNEYEDYMPMESPEVEEGEIVGGSEDVWGNENYELPCALYFYYMGDDLNSGSEFENWNTEYTRAVLGNCSAIQSIQYVPFLRKTDLSILGVPYDIVRFGSLQASHPKLDYTPLLHRIMALNNDVKTLGTFTCYETLPDTGAGKKRNWKNESRLYNYPYSFAMITDHLNPPIEIKYHLIPNNKAIVKVLQTISDRCSYGIFVDGYKGDDGRLEAMVSGDAHELPCSSSAYNQWFASNKNQMSQAISNQSQNVFLNNDNISNNQVFNILNSGAGVVGNLMTGNFGGAFGSVTNGLQNNMNMNFQKTMNNVGLQQQIAMNSAQMADLRNTPYTMISMGSDVYYGLSKGKFELTLYRFGLTEEYYSKLGDYFAMYGYKQSRMMNININSRYFYNYIKTVGVNISGTNIPRNHLEEIKSILDNGVTIWHTFRDNVIVGDYTYDNYEV